MNLWEFKNELYASGRLLNLATPLNGIDRTACPNVSPIGEVTK